MELDWNSTAQNWMDLLGITEDPIECPKYPEVRSLTDLDFYYNNEPDLMTVRIHYYALDANGEIYYRKNGTVGGMIRDRKKTTKVSRADAMEANETLYCEEYYE